MSERIITAADLFCGAGGTSSGLYRLAERLGLKVRLTAINHWSVAVATHAANHPDAEHICADIGAINPLRAIPAGKLDLLVASPECIFHSRARGGRPVDDQRRQQAFSVIDWANALRPGAILIENVPEFQQWGPVDDQGKPIKHLAGRTFRAWLSALRSLGYHISYHVVCCADFGDPTTRERLFILATLGRRPRWPHPTHAEHPDRLMVPRLPWVPAREIIDWTLPGESIFGRKRPLSPNTLKRIEAGLRKFCGLPYVVTLNGTQAGQIVASARSTDAPLASVVGSPHHYLAEPFVLGQQSGAAPRGVDMPLPTIATDGAISLTQPFLTLYHGANREGGDRARSIDLPVPTVATSNQFGLAEPFLVSAGGPDVAPRSVDEPMRTVLTRDHEGLVEPFLVKFNGTGGPQSVEEPLDTVTTKDRHGLVLPLADGGHVLLDIRFRMLQPHELAAAMSFPRDYQFTGTREQRVKQIGNAVPCRTSEALCGALLA